MDNRLKNLLEEVGIRPAKTDTEKKLDDMFSGTIDPKQVLDDLFETFGRIFSPDANPNIDFLRNGGEDSNNTKSNNDEKTE